MKKFLYGRLKARDNGYDFYIRPLTPSTKALRQAVVKNFKDEGREIVLQNQNGVIVFGVREVLAKQDHFGRNRGNFLGFQLEPHEGPDCLPFFDALSLNFGAITAEANICHDRLDEDLASAEDLRDTDIKFGRGNFQPGNDWDEAVMKIRNTPSHDFVMMFDQRGMRLPLPEELPSPSVQAAPPASVSGPGHTLKAKPAAKPAAKEETRLFVVPLEPLKRKSGFLGIEWKKCRNLLPPWKLRSKKQPASDGDYTPEP